MIDRQKVLKKHNGHCAYCGKEITLKTMQVDHIIPVRGIGTDDFNNLNPSCRRCNYYKRGYTIEHFRQLILTLNERVMKNYIVKVAIDFGIISVKGWNSKFYFEEEQRDE